MDHTPTTAASDDRPFRILDRTPVDAEHKERLFHLVRQAQAAAREAGSELQAEFGAEAVALIVGCNQFIRLFRGGTRPGVVELWLDDRDKQALRDAGFDLMEPEGAIFRMFGWVRIDPTKGNLAALDAATAAAFAKASAKKGK